MRRFTSLFLAFFLVISTSPISLAAPSTTLPDPSAIVRSLAVAPYVAMAGEEITVSADLDLPHQPPTVTMTFTEVGPNPVKAEILLRRADDGTYSGAYTFPEVLDHSLGMIPTELSYTRIEPYGERVYQHPIVTSYGGFFVMRHTVKLLSWEMPPTAFVGDTVPISLTFASPLPFQAPIRAVFESTNLVTPVTVQSEALTGDGTTLTTTVTLPATPARYELKGLRVGDELVPLYHARQAALEIKAQNVPQPVLTDLLLSWSTELGDHLSASFTHPDSIIGVRAKLVGPYRYEGWFDLARQDDGSFTTGTDTLSLPYTGNYSLAGIQIATKRGAVNSISQDQLWQWGYLGFFHIAPIMTPPAFVEQSSTQVADIRIVPPHNATLAYGISISAPQINTKQLSIIIAGNRATYTASCTYNAQTGEWEGKLSLPSWAKGGRYLITQVLTDDGVTVPFLGNPSIEHQNNDPDTKAPTIVSAKGSGNGLTGQVDLVIRSDRSGVKSVRLDYIHPATGAMKKLVASELSPGRWRARSEFTDRESGYWALASAQLEDYAGNTANIGMAAYDDDFYPEAGFIIDRMSGDRIPPDLSGLRITREGGLKSAQTGLSDNSSGIDLASIVATIQGTRIPVIYDPIGSRLTFAPVKEDGSTQLVELQVPDRAGNRITHYLAY